MIRQCTIVFGCLAVGELVVWLTGISMGTASHAVGTSRAMEKGETYGAYSSLGLILKGSSSL